MTNDPVRPWWASPDPESSQLDADEDPIGAARSARRGATAGERDGEAHGPVGGHGPEPCGVCPLCSGWRLLSESRPETAEHLAAAGRHLAEARPEVATHLAAAGRHLATALRHLMDDPEEASVPDTFERIDVDGDGDDAERGS